eukprot:SAG31_NODE_632_length_13389_cov_4.818360_14_plen_96_part_00
MICEPTAFRVGVADPERLAESVGAIGEVVAARDRCVPERIVVRGCFQSVGDAQKRPEHQRRRCAPAPHRVDGWHHAGARGQGATLEAAHGQGAAR